MRLEKNTIVFDNEIELNSFENYIKLYEFNNTNEYIENILNMSINDVLKALNEYQLLENKINKSGYSHHGVVKQFERAESKVNDIKSKIGIVVFEAIKHNAIVNTLLAGYQFNYYQNLSDGYMIVFYPAYGSSVIFYKNKTFYQKVEVFYNHLLTVL